MVEAEKGMIRLYGDISPKHEADFLLIKGVFGCKSNGEALERIITMVIPEARRQAAKHNES